MKILLDYIGFELKRFFSNTRLVIIFFISPILATAVFALITYQAPTGIKIGIVQPDKNDLSQQIAAAIKTDDTFIVRSVKDKTEGIEQFKTGKIKSLVVIDTNQTGGLVIIYQDPRYPEVQGVVGQHLAILLKDLIYKNTVEQIVSSVEPYISKISDAANNELISIKYEPITIASEEYLPHPIRYFDRFASGMIPLVIVLIFLLKAASSLSQDRENGVLERLFSTPASRRKLMLGKIFANVLIGLISVIAIVVMLKLAFGITLGSWLIVLLVAFLTAIVSVTMGILISAIVKDLPSTIQFSFYTFFMMVLTSEFFFAKENIYKYFKWVSDFNPLTYSISALRKVNLFNWGIREVWIELTALAAFAIIYTVIAIVLIERESK